MSTTNWLTGEEQQGWLALVASTTLLDTALGQQLQRDSGITHTAYAILAALSGTAGRTLHMGDLAVVTNSSQSRLSHAVSKLEAQGLVTRSPCPDHRRTVHATLTDAGLEAVTAAAPAHVATVRTLVFDHLSAAQVQSLTEICTAVLHALAGAGFRVPERLLPNADAASLRLD